MTQDILNTTTGSLSTVQDFAVDSAGITEATTGKEGRWNNDYWDENIKYYKTIPQFKQAIDGLAMWTVGKGWSADLAETEMRLRSFIGWGEDSFQSICDNHIRMKKINGDAYTQIIRDDEKRCINLKPLTPNRVTTVTDENGLISHYEYKQVNGEIKKIDRENMLHSCNDRIAGEIHGLPVAESCKWVIDAMNEAMRDWRRLSHRSTIRVMFVPIDDTARLNQIKTQYAQGIDSGDIMLIPVKRSDVDFEDLTAVPITNFLEWIRYLEQYLYKCVGVPEVIMGGSQNYTEASSKMGVLTFEQPYMTEQMELETDIWNQLGYRVRFNRPVSLSSSMQSDEAANTGQTAIQPSDLTGSQA